MKEAPHNICIDLLISLVLRLAFYFKNKSFIGGSFKITIWRRTTTQKANRKIIKIDKDILTQTIHLASLKQANS